MKDPANELDCYLVGGAVRDELLGLARKDCDWVVVGATPQRMRELSFKQIGKSFPVFLHPQTKDEYALARTERKSGRGHSGFIFNATPDVTLEQDLQRRDLTINAMARDKNDALIDPYHGRTDVDKKILRHVSTHFSEDALRVLRVARFHARYAERGFTVADETMQLMRNMVQSGEVDELTAERVWMELVLALGENKPSAFFQTLRECGALARVFPEVHALFGVAQPRMHHPEGCAGTHVMLALDQSARITTDTVTRFAVLTHDLGKALTPRSEWPRHRGHEVTGLQPIQDLCTRLRAPRLYRETALKICRYHLLMHMFYELRAVTVIDLFMQLDAFRAPQNVTRFADACEADTRGRTHSDDIAYPQREHLFRCYEAACGIDASAVLANAPNKEPRDVIRRARANAVHKTLKDLPQRIAFTNK